MQLLLENGWDTEEIPGDLVNGEIDSELWVTTAAGLAEVAWGHVDDEVQTALDKIEAQRRAGTSGKTASGRERKKAEVDSSLARVLRNLVANAHAGARELARSGAARLEDERPPPFVRVAKGMFNHIAQALAKEDVFKAFVGDYVQLLITYLLPTPAYASRLSNKIFKTLMHTFTEKLQHFAKGDDRSVTESQAYDCAKALSALLRHYPRDLSAEREGLTTLCVEVAEALSEALDSMDDEGRTAMATVGALNELLARDGLNMSGLLPTLHASNPAAFVTAGLSSATRLAGLKEALVMHSRMLLSLGAGTTPRALAQLFGLLDKELSSPMQVLGSDQVFSYGLPLPRRHVGAIMLAADVLHQLVRVSDADASAAAEQTQAANQEATSLRGQGRNVRMRRAPPAVRVAEALAAGKGLWPLLAAVIARRHGSKLAPYARGMWLAAAVGALPQVLLAAANAGTAGPGAGGGGGGGHEGADSIVHATWLARFVAALAVSWPASEMAAAGGANTDAVSKAAAAAATTGAKEALSDLRGFSGTQQTQVLPHGTGLMLTLFAKAQECLVRWLPSLGDSELAQEACRALSAIGRRGLSGAQDVLPDVAWRAPVFAAFVLADRAANGAAEGGDVERSEQVPRQAAVELVTCAIASGASTLWKTAALDVKRELLLTSLGACLHITSVTDTVLTSSGGGTSASQSSAPSGGTDKVTINYMPLEEVDVLRAADVVSGVCYGAMREGGDCFGPVARGAALCGSVFESTALTEDGYHDSEGTITEDILPWLDRRKDLLASEAAAAPVRLHALMGLESVEAASCGASTAYAACATTTSALDSRALCREAASLVAQALRTATGDLETSHSAFPARDRLAATRPARDIGDIMRQRHGARPNLVGEMAARRVRGTLALCCAAGTLRAACTAAAAAMGTTAPSSSWSKDGEVAKAVDEAASVVVAAVRHAAEMVADGGLPHAPARLAALANVTRGVRDALRGPGAASGDDSKGLPAGVADDLAGALLVALDAGLAMTQAALDSGEEQHQGATGNRRDDFDDELDGREAMAAARQGEATVGGIASSSVGTAAETTSLMVMEALAELRGLAPAPVSEGIHRVLVEAIDTSPRLLRELAAGVASRLSQVCSGSNAHEALTQELLHLIDTQLSANPGDVGNVSAAAPIIQCFSRSLRYLEACEDGVSEAERGELIKRAKKTRNKLREHPSALVTWQSKCALAGFVAQLARLDSAAFLKTAQELLPQLLQDGDWRVRACAGAAAAAILERLPKPLHVQLERACRRSLQLAVPAARHAAAVMIATERAETTTLTLASLATASPVVEATCVVMLCMHAAGAEPIRGLAFACVESIAASLGYNSLFSLAFRHIPGLVEQWVRSEVPLSVLGVLKDLFGVDADDEAEAAEGDADHALDEVCTTLQGSLTAALVCFEQREELEWLADRLGMEPQQLVRNNFGKVIAWSLSMIAHQSKDGSASRPANNVLSFKCVRGLDKTEASSWVGESRSISWAIDELLQLVRTAPVDAPEDEMSSAAMAANIAAVEGGSNISTGPAVVWPCCNSEVALEAISTLRSWLANTEDMQQLNQYLVPDFRLGRHLTNLVVLENQAEGSARQSSDVLAALETLMHLLQERASTPQFIRHAVSIALRLSGIPGLADRSLRLIKTLIEKAVIKGAYQGISQPLSKENGLLVVYDLVPRVISTAVAIVERLYKSGVAQQREATLSAMLLLKEFCSDRARPSILKLAAEMEPLPDVAELAQERALQQSVASERPFVDAMRAMLRHARVMSDNGRARALEGLRQRAHEGANGGAEVVRAAQELTEIGVSLHDDGLVDLASSILSRAALGAGDVGVVAMPPAASRGALTAPARSECATFPPWRVAMGALILSSLCDLYMDSLYSTARRAEVALNKILMYVEMNSPANLHERHKLVFSLLSDVESGGSRASYVQPLTKVHLLHVRPFWKQRLAVTQQLRPVDLGRRELWECEEITGGFDAWICRLTPALMTYASDDALLQECYKIACDVPELALKLLPFAALSAALTLRSSENEAAVAKAVAEGLTRYTLRSGGRATMAALSMLEKLRQAHREDMRLFNRRVGKGEVLPRTWYCPYWAPVDCIAVADAALAAERPVTALLWSEMAFEAQRDAPVTGGRGSRKTSRPAGGWDSSAGLVRVEPPQPGGDVASPTRVLRDCCAAVGEQDSVAAAARGAAPDARLTRALAGRKWVSALQAADAMLATTAREDAARCSRLTISAASALRALGCEHVRNRLVSGTAARHDAAMDAAQCEVAWRLGEWEPLQLADTEAGADGEDGSSFNRQLLRTLAAATARDRVSAVKALRALRCGVARRMVANSNERDLIAQGILGQLLVVDQMEAVADMCWRLQQGVAAGDTQDMNLYGDEPDIASEQVTWLGKWADIRSLVASAPSVGFEHTEMLFAAERAALLALSWEGAPAHIARCDLTMASAARKAGWVGASSSALQRVAAAGKAVGLEPAEVQIEQAKLLCAEGESREAVAWLAHVARLSEGEVTPASKAYAAYLQGKWLASTMADSARNVVDGYLRPAATQLAALAAQQPQVAAPGGRSVAALACRSHFQLAQFSARAYRSAVEYETVGDGRYLVEHRERKREAIAKLTEHLKTDGKKLEHARRVMLSRKIKQQENTLKLDDEDAAAAAATRREMLRVAAQGYAEAMRLGDAYDLPAAFSLLSLWFNHADDSEVMRAASAAATGLPTIKWLPVVYQVAARLDEPTPQTEQFQLTIRQLLVRLAKDHPHHALHHIIALKNGDRIPDEKKTMRDAAGAGLCSKGKQEAAKEILKQLATCRAAMPSVRSGQTVELAEVVRATDKLVDVYLDVAFKTTETSMVNGRVTKTHGKLPMSARQPRGVHEAALLTALTPPRADMAYGPEALPRFAGFVDPNKPPDNPGGINAPILLKVHASDGGVYRQLVKSGSDDMRQDAVMEQLFELVNRLLARSPEAARRRLRVGTYPVVPFSPAAGCVGFVTGTVELGWWLYKDSAMKGAHKRYRPQDWSYSDCRNVLDKARNPARGDGGGGGKLAARLVEEYGRICNHFRPVLRHFFTEHFASPSEWLERRLAFTRSAATSSIVGYVVGLGDRHASNILISTSTAEVTHIDLGCAFEQGRLLRVPETVPFRLTRDVVDGMGVNGVEGPFRACAGVTMAVMRASKEALMTIVEVFIHDPLYNWTLNDFERDRRQRDDGEDGEDIDGNDDMEVDGEEVGAAGDARNSEATRALGRVRAKLDGVEGGEVYAPDGQVAKLIEEARDPRNLCALYSGWGSFL